MAKLNDLIVTIGLKTGQFDKKLGQSMSKMRNFGRNTKRLGRGLSAGLTAPLAAIGATSFQVAAAFEQSMAKVKAVSGATGEQFKSLENNAKQLGASTRFTASEVSALQLEYAKLGFSADEITQVTQATLNLAQATGSDLAQSAEVAGSTLRAFGMDASQTGKVTDVMAAAFSSSALDLDSFQDSMKYVAPVAKAAGVSLEEATAMLGQLANNGIKGSQAGTSLRRILQEVAGTGLDFGTAMQKTADEVINLADAKDEVGRTASSAFLVLKEGMKDVDGLTESLKKSKGAAAGMAATMDDTAEGAMKRMQSAIEGAQIEIGSALAPVMTELAGKISSVANAFTNLSDKTKKYIVAGAAIAAAIGPLMMILPPLISGLLALISPVGLVIAGIVGLAIAVVTFADEVAGPIASVINMFITMYNELGLVRAIFGGIKGVALGVFTFLYTGFQRLGMAITGVSDIMLAIFAGNFEEVPDIARKAFDDIADSVVEMGKTIADDFVESVTNELEREPFDLVTDATVAEAIKRLGDLGSLIPSAISNGATSAGGGPANPKAIQAGQIGTGVGSAQLMGQGSAAADAQSELNDQIGISISMAPQMEAAYAGIGMAMGGLITGTMSLTDVFAGAITGLANLLIDLGGQFIAAGVAAQAFFINLIANPAVAIAAGVGLVAAGAVIKGLQQRMESSPPALAKGGLAFGPTMAMVGDNKNAGIDPEVIAPLSKLKNMMGSGQNVVVTGKISGRDILLTSERNAIDRNRVRGF